MAVLKGHRRHEEYSCHWGFVLFAAKVWHWAIVTGLLKSFSIFIPHLVELMGTTYAVIGLLCGMTDSMGSIVAPLAAFIIKRSPARILAVIGALMCSGGVIGASFCTNIVLLGICMTCLGIGNVFLVVTITTALHEHFPVKFEVINSLAILGSPMGAFLTPVITENLLEFYGLHGTILILGGASLNLVVCALTVRPPGRRSRRRKRVDREYVAVEKFPGSDNGDDGVVLEERKDYIAVHADERIEHNVQTKEKSSSLWAYFLDITNLSILQRNPFYFFLLIANFLMMVVWMGWTLFLVPHAESLGISQSQAAYLAMIAGIGGICGLVCSSIFLHFYPGVGLRLPAITTMIGACVFFLDLVSSRYVFQAVHAFIVGFIIYHICVYISIGVKYALPPEDFAMGLALALVAYGIGSICGGLGSGLIYDLTRDYKLVFVAFGMSMILISLCYIGFMLAQRYQRKKKKMQHRTKLSDDQC